MPVTYDIKKNTSSIIQCSPGLINALYSKYNSTDTSSLTPISSRHLTQSSASKPNVNEITPSIIGQQSSQPSTTNPFPTTSLERTGSDLYTHPHSGSTVPTTPGPRASSKYIITSKSSQLDETTHNVRDFITNMNNNTKDHLPSPHNANNTVDTSSSPSPTIQRHGIAPSTLPSLSGSSIQAILDSINFEILRTATDGHCLLHAIGQSWKEQLSHAHAPSYSQLKDLLLREETNNSIRYLPFLNHDNERTDGRLAIKHGIHNYVFNKIFDNAVGDLIPMMLTNALHFTLVILDENHNSAVRIHTLRPTLRCHTINAVVIHRKNDHYSALGTVRRNGITNSHDSRNATHGHTNQSTSKPQLCDHEQLPTTVIQPTVSKKKLRNNLTNAKKKAYAPTLSHITGPNYHSKHNSCTDKSRNNITGLPYIQPDTKTMMHRSNPRTLSTNEHLMINHHIPVVSNQIGGTKSNQSATPYRAPTTCSTKRRDKYVTISHINTRSFCVQSKMDEIKHKLTSENIDVLCLTETWLHPDIPSEYIEIENYTLIRRDRAGVGKGGGICIFVRDVFTVRTIDVVSTIELDNTTEVLCVQIQLNKNKAIIVAAFYRNPRGKASSFSCIEQILKSLLLKNKSIYCLGDFNDNLLGDEKICKNMSKIIQSLNLKQLIKEPTRVTIKSQTLIDLIITNDELSVLSTNQKESNVADHHQITCVINIKKPRKQHKQLTFRTHKDYSPATLQTELLKRLHLLEEITRTDNVDRQCSTFQSVFNDSLNCCAPVVTRTLKRPPVNWMTNDIKNKLSERDQINIQRKHNPGDKSLDTLYRKLKKEATKMITDNKRKINFENLDKYKTDKKNQWKIMKDIVPNKGAKSDLRYDNPEIIANEFNTYLVNVGSNLFHEVKDKNANPQSSTSDGETNGINVNSHDQPQKCKENSIHTYKTWRPEPVHPYDICRAISLLNNTNATGDDGIALRYIKDSLLVTSSYITIMINTSIVTGIVPKSWKHAVVSLKYKNKGNKSDPSNFRPISLLPVLSKILEKVIAMQLTLHMEQSNKISPSQFAYRRHRSTENALINITDKLYQSIDSGHISLLILLDLSKAFDSINHKLLLEKLRNLQIDTFWFENYLLDRTQSVRVNNSMSTKKEIKFGVPQGSILGPILFSIFVNDLPSSVTHGMVTMYADDTQLLYTCQPHQLNEIKALAENDLSSLTRWYNSNGLKVNANKTQAILISSKASPKSMPPDFCINFNNQQIKPEREVKNLGVWMDANLTYKDHIQRTSSKMNGTLMFINRVKHLLDEKSRLLLVSSLVLSNLYYCNLIWGRCSTTSLNKLQVSMNFAAKVACAGKFSKRDHVTPLIQKLNWLNVNNIIKLYTAIFMHKAVKNSLHNNGIQFSTRSSVSGRQTRNDQQIQPRFCKSEFGKKAISTAGPTIWNSIPPFIRHESTLSSFIKYYTELLLADQN